MVSKKVEKEADSGPEEADKKAVVNKEDAKLTDLPGIGPAVAAKLESAGVFDLMSLAVMGPTELGDAAGVSSAVARKAIQAARTMLDLGFQTGIEYEKKRSNVCNITTGSKNIDELLGGKGIESRAITEAFGAYGSGKCISKDTEVCYFNDTRMHVEQIEKTYEKYKNNAEKKFDNGLIVPVSTVKVMAWNNGSFNIVNASYLYKEKVKSLFLIKTKRGRTLKVTGNHQLLSFNEGVCWKKAGLLSKGDLIASPKSIDLETENVYDEDDAYFLGMFVAEGTSNPFSICTGSEMIKGWIVNYVKKKFNYFPTVRVDERKENPVYVVLLRKETREIMRGLDNCNAGTKFIPEPFFLSSKNIVLSFLGGYFDGDAEVSSHDLSVTTKSKKLASQLCYLLLRLGISASVKQRKTKKHGIFEVVRISGEDREKLSEIKFKLKHFNPLIKNSAYGYPRKIISFISELYKESLGGNRGSLRKNVGKINVDSTVYQNLTDRSHANVINSKTLNKIEEIFLTQKDLFISILRKLEKDDFSADLLKEVYPKLPFAFSDLAENMNVKKKSIRNYYSRKIPKDKAELLRNLIVNELKTRIDTIFLILELISEIKMFKWDVVESISVVDYDDYVYDFVVPEAHSFIGGNLPTVMHNTQLGLTLAVNVQLPIDKGGSNGKCVFIDTEGTFRPVRIKQIAEGIGANPEKVLKNILVARAFNSDHQVLLLEKVTEMIKQGEPIKLLIVDSLTAHFRAEFAGRGMLADRQQRLNRYMHQLAKLAEQHNLSVFVTNQVMSNPAQLFGDPTTAIGGNIVGHACLTGDSLIQLADGSIKEIKEMKKGNEVLTSNFSKMSLEKNQNELVFVNSDVKKKYDVKTNCQISCSELHRFFTIENFEIVEKEAKDLERGDFIAQIGKINIEGDEQRLPLFNVKRIGKLSIEDSNKITRELKKDNLNRNQICDKIGITPRQFRRVLNQSYPTDIDIFNKLQTYFSGRLQLQIIPVQSYKHRNLVMPEVINSQLAQIFGYFIGDGNFEERGLRFKDARIEVLEFYNSFFKQIFNIEGKMVRLNDKNCYTLNINSKEIKDLFILILPQIFDYVGKSKSEVVKGFIKGFIDAEGHINKKRAMITVAQKEKQILRYMQLFLLRVGIRSTIKFDIGRKKINVLRVADKDVKDYLQIGFTAKDKQKKLIERIKEIDNTYSYEMMPIARKELRELLENCGLRYSKFIKPRGERYKWVNRNELDSAFKTLMNLRIKDRQIKQKIEFIFKLLSSDLRFVRIREIKITENFNKELFYDFSVPLRENYLANGFIVHNSTYRMYLRRGKQGSRVAKLIDSPNLPDNETVFYVTEGGVKDEA